MIFSRVLQSLDHTLGFCPNWIMQGSRSDIKPSEHSENYIFFEKSQALKFSKNNERNNNRYNGKRGASLHFIAKTPKIFVYHLEDFLDNRENQIIVELIH